MSKVPGYENSVICPYNKCHVILRSRIQTHLIKCAKQHPHIKLETCPFDITHRFRPEEKDIHIDECPSRENYDRYLYSIGNSSRSEQKPATESQPKGNQNNRKNNDDDDDWD